MKTVGTRAILDVTTKPSGGRIMHAGQVVVVPDFPRVNRKRARRRYLNTRRSLMDWPKRSIRLRSYVLLERVSDPVPSAHSKSPDIFDVRWVCAYLGDRDRPATPESVAYPVAP
jgi:hypothetical protein